MKQFISFVIFIMLTVSVNAQSESDKKDFLEKFFESFKNENYTQIETCFVDSLMMNQLFIIAKEKDSRADFDESQFDELQELRNQAKLRFLESVRIERSELGKSIDNLNKIVLDSVLIESNVNGPASSFGASLHFKNNGYSFDVIVYDKTRNRFFIVDDYMRKIKSDRFKDLVTERAVDAVSAIDEVNKGKKSSHTKSVVTSGKKEEPIFQSIEVMPEFPGGEDKMYEFIVNNLQYPKEAHDKGTEGIVYIQFVIEQDGSVSQSKIMRDIGNGCGKAAREVVDKMPKWKPGTNKGKAVRVYFTLPFEFSPRE